MTSDLTHTIPDWYIPDEEVVLTDNEPERERILRNGEEPLEDVCPHCGCEYEVSNSGMYIHTFRAVEGDSFPPGRGVRHLFDAR